MSALHPTRSSLLPTCHAGHYRARHHRSPALADIVAAFAASGIREGAAARPALIRRLREASGVGMIALGFGLVLAKRPAT